MRNHANSQEVNMSDRPSSGTNHSVDSESASDVQTIIEDIQTGLKTMRFGPLIDNLSKEREKLGPERFKAFLTALNQGKNTQAENANLAKVLPNIQIVDLHPDERVVSFRAISGRTASIDENGKPVHMEKISERGEPLPVERFEAQNGLYTPLAPPGLGELPAGTFLPESWTPHKNTELRVPDGNYNVVYRTGDVRTNADGSKTYNYKGELETNRDLWQPGSVSFGHIPDTKFQANETISSDSKLLGRHVDYEPQTPRKTFWGYLLDGGDYSKYQFTVNRLDLGRWPNGSEPKSVDVRWNPQIGRYEGQILHLDGVMDLLSYTANGDLQSVKAVGCVYHSGLKRDSSGWIMSVTTNISYRFDRYADGAVKTFYDDSNHRTWNRTGDRTWTVTDSGKSRSWTGDIYTDDEGNVIRTSAAGTEIQDKYGEEYVVNAQGKIVATREITVDHDGTRTTTTVLSTPEPWPVVLISDDELFCDLPER